MNNNINSDNTNNANSANTNEEIKNKTVEIKKKSAIPVLSVGVVWLLYALIFGFFRGDGSVKVTPLFLAAVLSFIVYQIAKWKFPPKKVQIVTGVIKTTAKPKPEPKENIKKADKTPLTPEERELKDLNERIDLYFIEMKLLNDSIGDEFISNHLLEIENTLKKIQFQLNDDAKNSRLAPSGQSKRNAQLGEFFDYYMPTTIKILNSYKRIESQNLTGDNATETKKRVEESLPFVKKAFDKELDNMFSEEMLDITTDIDVLESIMSKEGVIDKNNIDTVRNISDDMKNDFFN